MWIGSYAQFLILIIFKRVFHYLNFWIGLIDLLLWTISSSDFLFCVWSLPIGNFRIGFWGLGIMLVWLELKWNYLILSLKFWISLSRLLIIILNRRKLSQVPHVVSSQTNVDVKIGNGYNFSLYFLKGNDPNSLSADHQRQIANFVASDSLSSSLLIYNPAESARRIAAWKTALPWIQPHYAIKSCPSMDLIRDLAGNGAGMDCASRAEI